MSNSLLINVTNILRTFLLLKVLALNVIRQIYSKNDIGLFDGGWSHAGQSRGRLL